MKEENPNRAKDEQQRSAMAGWDNDGGAAASSGRLKAEAELEQSRARDARCAAFDTTHDSSVRGEHRYPDTHQTEAEQKARHDRDALKRKLGGMP
jgi:hypothetical protein